MAAPTAKGPVALDSTTTADGISNMLSNALGVELLPVLAPLGIVGGIRSIAKADNVGETLAGAAGVASGTIGTMGLVGQLAGLPALAKVAKLLGPLGAVAGAFGTGYSLGTILDQRLGLSDRISDGIDGKNSMDARIARQGLATQQTRGVAGMAAAEERQRKENPEIYYAEQVRKEMVKTTQRVRTELFENYGK